MSAARWRRPQSGAVAAHGSFVLRSVLASDLSIFYKQQLDPNSTYAAAFTRKYPRDRRARSRASELNSSCKFRGAGSHEHLGKEIKLIVPKYEPLANCLAGEGHS